MLVSGKLAENPWKDAFVKSPFLRGCRCSLTLCFYYLSSFLMFCGINLLTTRESTFVTSGTPCIRISLWVIALLVNPATYEEKGKNKEILNQLGGERTPALAFRQVTHLGLPTFPYLLFPPPLLPVIGEVSA